MLAFLRQVNLNGCWPGSWLMAVKCIVGLVIRQSTKSNPKLKLEAALKRLKAA